MTDSWESKFSFVLLSVKGQTSLRLRGKTTSPGVTPEPGLEFSSFGPLI